jgi:hypothetical protein
LDDTSPVLVAGQDQFSAQFRGSAPGPPEGLPFLHPPAGTRGRN